ncbi:hypothetical protein [Paenibacillus massiliensis]|uniref:hypothetical protein n=1 Tax=Paenibacillus massiliensis TaxID=225917 RepID=UPI000415EE5F|nr:hypothetical protein [Paenibacillus massiliensis]
MSTSMSRSKHLSQATDDYLDLLNYAQQLGDELWEQELIHILRHLSTMHKEEVGMTKPVADMANNYNGEHDEHEQEEVEELINRLWDQFDAINERLAEMMNRLRSEPNARERRLWNEQIWMLKMERMQLEIRLQDLISNL